VAFSLEAPPKISHELYSAWDDARKAGADTTSVRLLVRSRSEFLDPSVRQALTGAGGTIEIVEGPWIQVSIPFSDLPDLASVDVVELVKLPAPHVFLEETEVLEALARETAPDRDVNTVQAAEPFEIAVFEFGFQEQEIRGLLPQADLSFHTFRADGRIEGGGAADHVHGTAVVSAIADYVPQGARVHLINFDTEPEFHRALDYAVNRLGVRVVTCSVSWSNAYDHYDGTSYFSRRTAEILGNRTAMIVAAGNFALGHWQSDFADVDGDRGHDFGNAGQLLEIRLSSNRTYNLLLSWNDWDRPSTNLDMEIYDRSGQLLLDPKGRPYASRNVQTGSRYPEPVERIRGFRPIYPGVQSYYVRVTASEPSSAGARPNMELYVSPPPNEAAPQPDPESSLASGLATTMSKSIIPVGAVELNHSSQGPTNDGRTRPDFAADGTASVDGRQVRGTSFAAPRIGAALSLIFSRHPDWSLDEALDMLRRMSDNPTGSSKNNQTGWGRLDVDDVIAALTS
jgi:hypothetical protein